MKGRKGSEGRGRKGRGHQDHYTAVFNCNFCVPQNKSLRKFIITLHLQVFGWFIQNYVNRYHTTSKPLILAKTSRPHWSAHSLDQGTGARPLLPTENRIPSKKQSSLSTKQSAFITHCSL